MQRFLYAEDARGRKGVKVVKSWHGRGVVGVDCVLSKLGKRVMLMLAVMVFVSQGRIINRRD